MEALFINAAKILRCTEAEGPGKRYCIWVQGCLLRCPGCCNGEMLPIAPRHILASQEVISDLSHAAKEYSLEGLTLLGGEPLLQARGLAPIATHARTLGLSVLIFSGYSLDGPEIKALVGSGALLDQADVLVDGPFILEQRDSSRNWVGSRNQRFHYLSSRYTPAIETMPVPSWEIRVKEGCLSYNGSPHHLFKGNF